MVNYICLETLRSKLLTHFILKSIIKKINKVYYSESGHKVAQKKLEPRIRKSKGISRADIQSYEIFVGEILSQLVRNLKRMSADRVLYFDFPSNSQCLTFSLHVVNNSF